MPTETRRPSWVNEVTEVPSRQGTAAAPSTSTCWRLGRSIPMQGPTSPHSSSRSVSQSTSPCWSKNPHLRTTAPACSMASPTPSVRSTRTPLAWSRIPAPVACHTGLRSISSTLKPCRCKAMARVSPVIPPPTIKLSVCHLFLQSSLFCLRGYRYVSCHQPQSNG